MAEKRSFFAEEDVKSNAWREVGGKFLYVPGNITQSRICDSFVEWRMPQKESP